MKYRGRIELMAEVLSSASGKNGALITHIMYKSLLSHAQLKHLIQFLLANRLLKYDEGKRMFKTTEKGLEYLGLYNQMEELVKIRD